MKSFKSLVLTFFLCFLFVSLVSARDKVILLNQGGGSSQWTGTTTITPTTGTTALMPATLAGPSSSYTQTASGGTWAYTQTFGESILSDGNDYTINSRSGNAAFKGSLTGGSITIQKKTAGSGQTQFLANSNQPFGFHNYDGTLLGLFITGDGSKNVSINVETFGTNANTVLAIAEGVTPTTSPANAVQLYVQPIAADQAELFVRDEAGNVTQLSDHNNAYPVGLAVDPNFTRVSYDRQDYLGVERWIAIGKVASLVEALAKKEGLLPVDQYLVMTRAIPRQDWNEHEQEFYDKHEAKRAEIAARKQTLLNAMLAEQDPNKAAVLSEEAAKIVIPSEYVKRSKPKFLEAK